MAKVKQSRNEFDCCFNAKDETSNEVICDTCCAETDEFIDWLRFLNIDTENVMRCSICRCVIYSYKENE